jgi:hypothetical protein
MAPLTYLPLLLAPDHMNCALDLHSPSGGRFGPLDYSSRAQTDSGEKSAGSEQPLTFRLLVVLLDEPHPTHPTDYFSCT